MTMAASKRPRARTVSTSSLETARGTHTFKIADYSSQRGLRVGRTLGRFVRSAAFTVAGHNWCICCYPAGTWRHMYTDYVGVYLALLSKNTEVTARFTLSLVDQATGLSVVLYEVETPRVFTTKADAVGPGASTAGSYSFIKKTELEASPYMRDDSIVIECDVTVVTNKRPRLDQGNQATMDFELEVPPSDLSDNLGKLLEEKKGSDVTFEVGGEVFPAHRAVLAMRSPVFDAELFGPMEEKTSQLITVQDMNPDVFRALLHFIYTDSMPDMEGFDDDDIKEMIKHLIIAADRYAMGRLKRICEGILCKSLDAQNVATIHALADQHHCCNLKNACIEFIASSEIDKVVSSQEYVDLKKSSPTLLVHMLENVTRRLQ